MSGDQLIEATFTHLGLCEEAFQIAEIAITALYALLKIISKGFTMQIISSTYWNL
jgi:hypothetical protein